MEETRQALRRAAVEAAEREMALATTSPPADGGRDDLRQRLELCGERLNELKACAGRADKEAAEADADLRAGEEGTLAWLAKAAALGQKLADGLATEV
jgi:hypothetical protein